MMINQVLLSTIEEN